MAALPLPRINEAVTAYQVRQQVTFTDTPDIFIGAVRSTGWVQYYFAHIDEVVHATQVIRCSHVYHLKTDGYDVLEVLHFVGLRVPRCFLFPHG
jgi:hypothetical protein